MAGLSFLEMQGMSPKALEKRLAAGGQRLKVAARALTGSLTIPKGTLIETGIDIVISVNERRGTVHMLLDDGTKAPPKDLWPEEAAALFTSHDAYRSWHQTQRKDSKFSTAAQRALLRKLNATDK